MAAKGEIAEEIREIKENLTIRRKAERVCTRYDGILHYHELLWDAGMGNGYCEDSDSEYEDFIKKLSLRLQRVQ